ncbi:MAG TPA: papain-like cysteine protease family protein, partial [Lachnospiraceae bacterium]
NLSSSTPMICSVKPGDFTFTGHFIVLAGLDDSGKIIVNDPNSQKNSKKHWEIDRLLPQIKAIWKYSKIS